MPGLLLDCSPPAPISFGMVGAVAAPDQTRPHPPAPAPSHSTGWGPGTAVAAYLTVQVGVAATFVTWAGVLGEAPAGTAATILGSGVAFALTVAWWCLRVANRAHTKPLVVFPAGVHRSDWLPVGVAVAAMVAVAVGLEAAFGGVTNTEVLYPTVEAWPERAALVVGAVILAPIREELLYRGLLLGGFRNHGTRPWVAILVTSVAFGLAHTAGNPWRTMIGAGTQGAVLGWMTWRTGRLGPAVLAHGALNLIAVTPLVV